MSKRLCAITLSLLLCLTTILAQTPKSKPYKPAAAPRNAAAQDPGERVFNANCSRCHNAPEQLAPRITGTVIRHMRVRASISDADEKALLKYLAP